MPGVLWADSPVSKTLADNLQRFGRSRGMDNWNQMAARFREWSQDKPDLVMALNALVAAYVNGDGNTREAIRHMLKALERPARSHVA